MNKDITPVNEDDLGKVNGGAIVQISQNEWLAVDDKTGEMLGKGSKACAQDTASFFGQSRDEITMEQYNNLLNGGNSGSGHGAR